MPADAQGPGGSGAWPIQDSILYLSLHTYYLAHILPKKMKTSTVETSDTVEGTVYYTQGSNSKNTNSGNNNNGNHGQSNQGQSNRGQSNRGRGGYRGRGCGGRGVTTAIMATTTTTAIQTANNVPSLNMIPHNIVNSIVLPAILLKCVTPNIKMKITCNSCKVNRLVNNRNRIPHLNTA